MPDHDHPTDDGPLDEVDALDEVEAHAAGSADDELEPAPDEGVAEALEVSGGSEVQRARKRYGLAGAVVAGAMFGLRDVLEPPKDDVVVTVEASSKPVDIDADGISVPVDGAVQAVAPALPPKALVKKPKRRRADRSRS